MPAPSFDASDIYLLRLAEWSIRTHGGKEAFADRVSQKHFGLRLCEKFRTVGYIEPFGTTRLGDPAFRVTEAGRAFLIENGGIHEG